VFTLAPSYPYPVETTKSTAVIPARDSLAFDRLFQDYFVPLTQYARLYLKDEDEAKDLVQKLFTQMWEQPDRFEADSSMQGLLYSAVKNRCINRLKHEKVKKEHQLHSAQSGRTLYVVQDDDSSNLEKKIEKALQLLPDQCRRVFELSRIDGLKYKEIAEQLNISIKTVEVHMGKALRHMRTELAEYLPVLLLIFPHLF
jgi:RNA polymerase sigma-70 factor, ECF subfamily